LARYAVRIRALKFALVGGTRFSTGEELSLGP
jgi:hypothetical protein